MSLAQSGMPDREGGPEIQSSRQFFLLLKIAAVLAFAGCTHSQPDADLVVINGAEPESLDPAVITGEADGRVALEMFAGLTRYNPTDATPIPDLAESWDLSADGKVYTFHLRTNAVWSTSEPITAHDFVYSWLRVLNPASAAEYAGQLFYLKNGEAYNSGRVKDPAQVCVTAVDYHTLCVELSHPTAFFF